MNKLKLVFVMLVWGSIGLFTRFIPLSPIQLAFLRAVIALPVLVMLIPKKQDKRNYNKKSILLYSLSGVLIGLAWVSLFYGYRHTTIASAVIIYNMCPVYVMLVAPFVLKEKRTWTQIVVIGMSFLGLMMVVGTAALEGSNLFGIVMSGISGILYAVIVIINRKIKVKMESHTATFIQMASAALVLLPFILSENSFSSMLEINLVGLVLVVILGVCHTGIAYSMYFSTYHHMKSIDIVTFSYLEPVFTVLLGVLLLGEKLSVGQWIGASLILGSTFLGEQVRNKKAQD